MSLLRHFVLQNQDNARQLVAFVGANWKAMADQGRPMSVEVSEYKSKRTLAQNNLYWARLEEIADNAWVDGKQFTKDGWHHYFGNLFLAKIPTPDGDLIPVSTTTLDVADFTTYIEKIAAHAATELGLELTA